MACLRGCGAKTAAKGPNTARGCAVVVVIFLDVAAPRGAGPSRSGTQRSGPQRSALAGGAFCHAGFLAALLIAPVPLFAQKPQPGAAPDGMPGTLRVGHVTPSPAERLSVVGHAGYGFIEGGRPDGEHHRLFGGLAVSGRPLGWLALAGGLSGRFDVHPNDGLGPHSSGFGRAFFGARAGADLGPMLSLGGDVRVDLNGRQAPDVDLGASNVLLRALVTLTPAVAGYAGLSTSLALGAHIYGSGRLLDGGNSDFRPGDRVTLGASHFHRVFAGVAASYLTPLSDAVSLETIAEATWEPFFGDGAPGLDLAPLRIAAGARLRPIPELALSLTAEARLLERPGVQATDPVVPVEPRVSLLVGLAYRADFASEPAEPLEAETAATPEPSAFTLFGAVTGPDGVGIAGARVVASSPEPLAETQSDAAGRFALRELAAGAWHLEAFAEGYESGAVDVELHADTTLEPLRLEPMVVTGSVRGLVRDFRGRALAAEVQLEAQGAPGEGETLRTNARGEFEATVLPGTYSVEVSARGFRPRRRRVTVEENGVVILNLDLQRQRRRRRGRRGSRRRRRRR